MEKILPIFIKIWNKTRIPTLKPHSFNITLVNIIKQLVGWGVKQKLRNKKGKTFWLLCDFTIHFLPQPDYSLFEDADHV